jgi:hypothetical protein
LISITSPSRIIAKVIAGLSSASRSARWAASGRLGSLQLGCADLVDQSARRADACYMGGGWRAARLELDCGHPLVPADRWLYRVACWFHALTRLGGGPRDRRAGHDLAGPGRLGLQGIELLSTGRITLPVPGPDRAYLRSIRRGERPLAEVLDAVAAAEARLTELRDSPAIPDQPDRPWVDDWLHRSYLNFWAGHD